MTKELQKAVGKDVKRGGLVKLSSRVACDRPLTSELFQESCAYYKCVVKWEYEELTSYRETIDGSGNVTNRERLSHPSASDRRGSVAPGGGSDDDGSELGRSEGASYGGNSGESGSSGGYATRIHTDSSNGWEIIDEDRRHTRFLLQDESGQIAIDPDDAEIEVERPRREYLSGSPHDGIVRFGNFTRNIGQYLHSREKITRGFSFEEQCLSLGQRAFITGQVRFENSQPVIKKINAGAGIKFLITHKSHDLTTKALQDRKLYVLIGVIASLLVALTTLALIFARVLRF
ncbi:MAG: hypothetical protein HC919_11100 [Oscillatoriales cyanobacterium SM2_2_1]|nr:hypothetical protein [Oscillatoriales cyanobacterium SM2_2_1]